MIDLSLKFLTDELNKFLSLKLGTITTDQRLVLGNVFKATEGDGGGTNNLSNKAILSLVNVEEDRIAKIQENFVKTYDGVIYKSPPVLLNLYILISVNLSNYNEGLKWLSHFIQFFQYKNTFTPDTHPSLDPKIKKLIVDLYSLNFEQINHLWSTLGGKYLPSALYKVRQLTIDEEAVEFTSGFIKEIVVQDQLMH